MIPILQHRDPTGQCILRWPCGCVYQCASDLWLNLCETHRIAALAAERDPLWYYADLSERLHAVLSN